MAQVDIGKIKIVWKGPWNSGTAYTVDDAVSHSGNSYICIQAGTNQNPSSATAYWQIMASAGTNGTDADLLNISGTVQGDIYYNNGSAIARLAPGSASQVLQSGGAGANPSWGTLSSDFVKVHHTTTTSDANEVHIADCFSNTYKSYLIQMNIKAKSSDRNLSFRWKSGSGSTTQHNNNQYYGGLGGGEITPSGQNWDQCLNSQGTDNARLVGAGNEIGNRDTPNNYQWNGNLWTYNPHSSNVARFWGECFYNGHSESSTRMMKQSFGYEYRTDASTSMTGFKIILTGSNDIGTGTAISVYGIKE